MDKLLEVKGLTKRYERFALENVSFSIPGGYIMGFIGPNGAGKTTTIKCILNMVKADAGSISLFGREGGSDGLLSKEELGIVMDAPFYVEEWTLLEVERALSPFYQNWDRKRFGDCLSRFGLDPKKKVRDLSRGMKVKLMIAAALSHDAKLLILDEPTSGLDPLAREELMHILRDFVSDESRGILFSTHITTDLEKIADYITYINQGHMVFTGEKDALLEGYLLVKGGSRELTPSLQKRLIGLRQHSAGFTGLLPREELGLLPPGVAAEPSTLDEIMIYMSQEGFHHG